MVLYDQQLQRGTRKLAKGEGGRYLYLPHLREGGGSQFWYAASSRVRHICCTEEAWWSEGLAGVQFSARGDSTWQYRAEHRVLLESG